MTQQSFSDAENRMMFAEEFDDLSSETEIEDGDCIPFDDDVELDEFFQSLHIPDEEAEDCQIVTEKILATDKNPQMSLAWKNKTEKITSIHNLIRKGDFASIT